MCEICFIRRKSESTESVADFVTTAGAVGNGTQDLRTRHAVSDNKRKSGLGMPSPYIPEREQIQDRKAGLKRETENCGRCTQRPYHSPLIRSSAPRKGGGDYSRASGHIGSTSHSVRASHRSVLPSQGTDGHSVHLLKGLVRPYRGGYGEGSYH